MHYSVGVVVSKNYTKDKLEGAVSLLLKKFDSNKHTIHYYPDGTRAEVYSRYGQWDWYEIGGRWDSHIILKPNTTLEEAFNGGKSALSKLIDSVIPGASKIVEPEVISDDLSLVKVNGAIIKDIDFELTARPNYLLTKELFIERVRSKEHHAFFYEDLFKKYGHLSDSEMEKAYQELVYAEKSRNAFYAIVVDGEWHEVENSGEEAELLTGHESDWLVVVDCHN